MRRTRVRVQVVFEECDVETTGGDAIGVGLFSGRGLLRGRLRPLHGPGHRHERSTLARACAPALRDGLWTRLVCVAKERAIKAAGVGAQIVSSCTPYPVDSGVGRFRIPTYKIQGARGTVRTRDMFPSIRGKEHYLTKGFREIALLDGVVDRFYRQTSASINSVRHQANGGAPATTLRDVGEDAGTKIVDGWIAAAKETLAENGFSADGISLTDEDYESFRSVYVDRLPLRGTTCLSEHRPTWSGSGGWT